MANPNKLKFSGQSGITAGAIITDRTNDNVWDGTEMTTYVDASFATYLISVPEIGHGMYSAPMPTTLPAGSYLIAYYDTSSQEVIFQSLVAWDGVNTVDELETGGVSITDICNMALAHLGVTKKIANIETDTTDNSNTCSTFYETARDKVLADFPWPFANVEADLGLVQQPPDDEWDFSYRYPSNCITVIRIHSGCRRDSLQSRVPKKITRDSAGKLIYTDMENATLEYIFRETDPGRYDPNFILALSAYLATLIAPSVSKGDPFKLAARAMQLYMATIGAAQKDAANEETPDAPVSSEFERARD